MPKKTKSKARNLQKELKQFTDTEAMNKRAKRREERLDNRRNFKNEEYRAFLRNEFDRVLGSRELMPGLRFRSDKLSSRLADIQDLYRKSLNPNKHPIEKY